MKKSLLPVIHIQLSAPSILSFNFSSMDIHFVGFCPILLYIFHVPFQSILFFFFYGYVLIFLQCIAFASIKEQKIFLTFLFGLYTSESYFLSLIFTEFIYRYHIAFSSLLILNWGKIWKGLRFVIRLYLIHLFDYRSAAKCQIGKHSTWPNSQFWVNSPSNSKF